MLQIKFMWNSISSRSFTMFKGSNLLDNLFGGNLGIEDGHHFRKGGSSDEFNFFNKLVKGFDVDIFFRVDVGVVFKEGIFDINNFRGEGDFVAGASLLDSIPRTFPIL